MPNKAYWNQVKEIMEFTDAMVRMPDEQSKNPFTKLSSLLKQKPGSQNGAEEKEEEADIRQEEEKVKEIMKKRVVKY